MNIEVGDLILYNLDDVESIYVVLPIRKNDIIEDGEEKFYSLYITRTQMFYATEEHFYLFSRDKDKIQKVKR